MAWETPSDDLIVHKQPPTVGQVLTATSATRASWQTPGGESMATFSQAGALATGTGVSRFLLPAPGTLISVAAAVNTPSTGTSIICDVNKNGTTIFTTQANRPTIAINGHATTSSPTPDVTAFVAGDYLTVDIDQIGSGTAGSDLVVQVLFRIT